MTVRVLMLAAVVLAGCAADLHWTKPGAMEAEFQKDSYECARESTYKWKAGTGVWAMIERGDDKMVNKGLYRGCMRARGYNKNDPNGWEGFRD